MTDIYAASAHELRKKGYSPLPLPPGRKFPPPFGWTGELAHMASGPDIQFWIESGPTEEMPYRPAEGNIALRLPDGVIGLDVDQYGEKVGAETVREAIKLFGPLPKIGRLTSRPETPAGIRLFRVPPGTRLASTFQAAGLGKDVEILQHHHRYAVGPGSIHPETKKPYVWVGLANDPLAPFPAVADLPELPQAWIDGLQPKEREPREEIPHEAWDEMDSRMRERVGKYVGNAWTDIMAQLQDMKAWPADYRGEYGGWEESVLALTASLASLVKADWNDLGVEEQVKALELALPTDGGFTLGNGISKFLRAVASDRVEARLFPLEPEEDWWPENLDVVRPFVAAAGSSEPPAAVLVDENPDDWPEEPWNELGDVNRTKRWAAGGLYWLADEEVWVRWIPKEHRWAKDPKAGAKACQRALRAAESKELLNYDDAEQTDKDGVPKPGSSRRDKFIVEIRNRWGIGQVERVAKSLALTGDLDAESSEFDADGMLLAVKDGAVDLRTGAFVAGAKELKITVGSNVVFDPEAKAPMFERYLAKSMPDPAMREYLQRVMGYSLIGGNPESAFFIHWGPQTGNGKSVLMKVLRGIMGSQMRAASSKALIKSKGDKHTVEIADLAGPRVLQMGETADGAQIEEETIKAITGGDLIAARKLGESNRDWQIDGKVHIVTNHKPHISASPSMKRRMHLIVWPVEVIKGDQHLADNILAHELSGVLNWFIAGCLNWQKERQVERAEDESNTGLVRPASATMEIDEYLFEEDALAEWMLERLNSEAREIETKSSTLYEDYKLWCWPKNVRVMSSTAFGRKLRERKITSKRKNDGIYYPLALKVTVQSDNFWS